MLDCKYILITQLSSWFLGATTARAGKGRKGNVRQRRKNKRFEGHKQISDGSFAFVVFPFFYFIFLFLFCICLSLCYSPSNQIPS